MTSSPLTETLAALVRINSVNSAYVGGPGEREIATWIRAFFARRGIETREQEVFPNRPNVIARIPGRDPSRRVILEAHMDTASITGMTIPPFEPRIADGKLYGRGSCDTKGGLAAMMHAVAALAEQNQTPPCEVWFVAAVDEEYAFGGVKKLCEGLTAEAAIVAEPTSLRAVIATKGALRWRILTRGKAAHSSKPHLGVNAISHMARIILALEKDTAGLAGRSHPLLGSPTCNVGVISGGVQVNFVPDTCAIELDRRLLPGETGKEVLAHYQRLLDGVKRELPELDAFMETPRMDDGALDTPADHAAARCAQAVLAELGLNPELRGVPYGSDASKLARQGIPSLVYGPGSIDQAHAAVEFVDLAEVARAEEFYRNFLLRF